MSNETGFRELAKGFAGVEAQQKSISSVFHKIVGCKSLIFSELR